MREWLKKIGIAAAMQLTKRCADNWILISGVLVVLGIITMSTYLDWAHWSEVTYDASGKIKEVKTDLLKIIQQLGLFLLAIIGLGLAIWRSLTAHRQAQAALDQARTAFRQAENAERAQNVERYTRAAQMLESERRAVRQAGIYALRELALFDPKNHRVLAIELLSSFIRYRISEELTKDPSIQNAVKKPTQEIY